MDENERNSRLFQLCALCFPNVKNQFIVKKIINLCNGYISNKKKEKKNFTPNNKTLNFSPPPIHPTTNDIMMDCCDYT